MSAKTWPLLSSSKVCPPNSLMSFSPLPSPPSLPHSRLGREEWAETPHWPRWLAANQLQPKVIGSRWETFWWREQGEQVASRRGGKGGKKSECKTQGEWKRDSKSVSCSGQLGEPFLSVKTLSWVEEWVVKSPNVPLISFQTAKGTVKGELA